MWFLDLEVSSSWCSCENPMKQCILHKLDIWETSYYPLAHSTYLTQSKPCGNDFQIIPKFIHFSPHLCHPCPGQATILSSPHSHSSLLTDPPASLPCNLLFTLKAKGSFQTQVIRHFNELPCLLKRKSLARPAWFCLSQPI